MKQETFEKLLSEAKQDFMGKKKQPTTPAKQFEKGARWLWDLLMEQHDITYYEDQLRQDIIARLDHVEPWQESLITEMAEKKVRLNTMIAEIERVGYLVTKADKNMMEYKESNPLLVHTKELERTIGMWREHLGLSFKVNPQRMKESPKKHEVDEKDPLARMMQEAKDAMESD